MMICTGCGEILRDAQLKRIVEPHGEVFLTCPACGDTVVEAVQCHCGEWHDPADLLPGGYCEICLAESMTREQMEAFIHQSGEWEAFLIDYWLNGREQLLELLGKFFHNKPEQEQMTYLQDYIYATRWGALEFAQWRDEGGGAGE